jgi:putative transposase
MTTQMMSLQALVAKSSDADLLRETIGFAAHRLVELEVENLTGAARGERSADRLTHRNGLPRRPQTQAALNQSDRAHQRRNQTPHRNRRQLPQ